jgi:type VI secretion system protein VasD
MIRCMRLVVLALLCGAGSLARGEPATEAGATTVELTLVGGPALNPNSQGRASPVVVRIFDLAAAQPFESVDFQALFDHPGDSLKVDLIAQEELVLRPGEILERNRTLQPGVRALGVAAAFRDLGHALWHLTILVKPGRRNFLLIDLDQDAIRLDSTDLGQS